jgi:tetratricopeptide (TPR) repeat protein
LSPYERGLVENLLFAISYVGGDYPQARLHLQYMIDSGGLNEQQVSAARFQGAQLFLAEEKWAEAAAAFEEWFKTAVNPNSQAYYMLAAAYFQMEDFDRALAPAEKAVELMTRPDVNWIQLLLAIYSERKEYDKAIPLLERLVVLQPEDKRWWVSLSMHHSLLEDQKTALAIMELANLAGLVKEQDELLRMAELADYNDLPYRCAKIITEGLAARTIQPSQRVYERNATCWMRAREFEQAITPLTRAAELNDNGDAFVRLAEVQTQRREWEGVVSAADKALEKGKLTDAAKANLLKGVALYNLDRNDDAKPPLRAAAESTQHRDMARGYLAMIEQGI